jgi:hypothetical protein
MCTLLCERALRSSLINTSVGHTQTLHRTCRGVQGYYGHALIPWIASMFGMIQDVALS